MSTKKNPGELLIFGNPKKRRARARKNGTVYDVSLDGNVVATFDDRATAEKYADGLEQAAGAAENPKKRARKNAGGTANHKTGCKCFACKHKRGENPACGSRHRKPASKITDRAARYRANAPECRPKGKRCIFCGNPEGGDVHHIDGHEKNTEPDNLAPACRPCNVTVGNVMKRAGLGTKTRQYNPSAGATSLAQWVTAVMSMRGESDAMTPAAAVDVIHATPASRRSEFAREIWRRRRRGGNATRPTTFRVFGRKFKGATEAEAKKRAGKWFDKKGRRAARKTFGRNPQRNPDERQEAVHLFESFHGKDAKEIVDAQISAEMRLDYAALGDLIAIGLDRKGLTGDRLVNNWEKTPHLAFAGVKLASAPNGKQLYAIGGRVDLAPVLKQFEGIDPEKDFVDVGEAAYIVYDARKKQSNFEPIQWVHQFGEDGGTLPRIMWNRLQKQIFLIGGEYFIDTSAGLSPGIEN